MVLKVHWSESALEDLDRALAFIAADNPEALWRQARTATRSLVRYPLKGRMVPEYQDPQIRELIVGPFRIVYTTEEPAILHILAAIRGERRLPSDWG